MKEADFKSLIQIYVPLANVTNYEECNKFAYPLSRGQVKKSAMKGYAPVKKGYIKKGRKKCICSIKREQIINGVIKVYIPLTRGG